MGKLKTYLILGIVLFCISTALYVSLPDYPRDCPAWALMLWGEESQWWSEITWIILFGLFSILCILLISWNKDLGASSAFQSYFRLAFSIIFILASFDYSIIYYQEGGFEEVLVLDRGGWLHGLFYLWTAMIGGLAFEELISYFARAHEILCRLTLPQGIQDRPIQSLRKVHQKQATSSARSPERSIFAR